MRYRLAIRSRCQRPWQAEGVTKVHNVQLLNTQLEREANRIVNIGGIGTLRIHAQADAMYALYLDLIEAGQEIPDLPLDFTRWFRRVTGNAMSHGTIWNRLKAGRARATGSKRNRNQAGLIAEIRERELTPVEAEDWDSD